MSNEAIQFDTHKFIKHMTKVGFTEEQAEVIANQQINLINSNLATKEDIASIHADIAAIHADIATIHADIATIHADIAKLRLETQKDIEKSKVELIKWMVGAMIAQGAVVVSLVVGLMSLIIFNT